MSFTAQKLMQARRMQELQMVERNIAIDRDGGGSNKDKDLHDRLSGSDSEEYNDEESAISLLRGRAKHIYPARRAGGSRENGPSRENRVERGRERPPWVERPLSLFLGACFPCLLLARAASLLARSPMNAGNRGKSPCNGLDMDGWKTCLSAAVVAMACPLPCLWPSLWWWRKRQRHRILQRFPHFPDPVPTSSSGTSGSDGRKMGVLTACQLCAPCPLVSEVAFLEEVERLQREKERLSGSTGTEGDDENECLDPGKSMATCNLRNDSALRDSPAKPFPPTPTEGKKENGGKRRDSVAQWQAFESWDLRPVDGGTTAVAATGPSLRAVENEKDTRTNWGRGKE